MSVSVTVLILFSTAKIKVILRSNNITINNIEHGFGFARSYNTVVRVNILRVGGDSTPHRCTTRQLGEIRHCSKGAEHGPGGVELVLKAAVDHAHAVARSQC